MELLRTLTLVYAGVLVAALAASLITILVYLWRIGSVLGDTREALRVVVDRTRPLPVHLEPLRALRSADAAALEEAADALHRADACLADALAPTRAGAA